VKPDNALHPTASFPNPQPPAAGFLLGESHAKSRRPAVAEAMAGRREGVKFCEPLMVTNITNFQQDPESDRPTARGMNTVRPMKQRSSLTYKCARFTVG
jgi:hypothetical protein